MKGRNINPKTYPHQVQVRLNHAQKAKLECLGARLGGDNAAEHVRRCIEALFNAHTSGLVNLDLIRYQNVTQKGVNPCQKNLSQWLEVRPSNSDGRPNGENSP